ncbi:hypothetical protein [Campylobacter troglodytis]|uniref:hypothetical protein n=1 Tax=Campylobacter troglodytis TaxID=654363 RepID=UPI001159A2F2|nr:hypothetical protein [Campylobacter troglodytis]TQR60543.1 hypothetical protein DMC01_05210 [Campylobacter troglodytis]
MKLTPAPDLKAHNQFLNNRKEQELYLGINTNINCLDNWCSYTFVLERGTKIKHFRGLDASFVIEHKIGLYLGKIIFKKNKDSNLIPHYIPSNIQNLKEELTRINPLWLDELNKDYKLDDALFDSGNFGENYKFKSNKLKLLCKNSKQNITLNKEQILSYFTELHKLNTSLIKDYIDSINKEEGIKAYMPTQNTYKSLLNLGILQEDMFEWGFDGTLLPKYYARLVAIDYMKTQKQALLIPYFNELFYAYLVWSLKEFTILYHNGYIAEKKNMLFNLCAYIDDRRLINKHDEPMKDLIASYFYENYKDLLTPELQQELLFSKNMYISLIDEIGSFALAPSYYIPIDETSNKKDQASFKTPNLDFFGDEHIKPSPLGNYYFELKDNQDSFVEYYKKSYPKKPPKHWSKEMMARLELELE